MGHRHERRPRAVRRPRPRDGRGSLGDARHRQRGRAPNGVGGGDRRPRARRGRGVVARTVCDGAPADSADGRLFAQLRVGVSGRARHTRTRRTRSTPSSAGTPFRNGNPIRRHSPRRSTGSEASLGGCSSATPVGTHSQPNARESTSSGSTRTDSSYAPSRGVSGPPTTSSSSKSSLASSSALSVSSESSSSVARAA